MKKILQILLCICVFALVTDCSFAQKKSPSISLTLASEKYEFSAGAEIVIGLKTTNLTKKLISFKGSNTGNVDSTMLYEVFDEGGNPLAKKTHPHMELDASSPVEFSINPGDTDDSYVTISDMFPFNLPGTYVVRLSRYDPVLTDRDGNKVIVTSNPITITISE